jgi:hypothetical protein
MPFRDVESLRQFTGTRAKAMDVIDSAARSHDAEAPLRLERSNQNEPAPAAAFHEHIEHPVHAIVHVNVDCPGHVSLDERASARPGEGVGSFVVQAEIRFRLDHDAGASSPNQLGAHEFARTDERVALEKGRRQNRPFYYRHDNLPRSEANAAHGPTVRNKRAA